VRERTLARSVVGLTVAVVTGSLFWIWGELNWKNLGSRHAVAGVALLGTALGGLFAVRMARRPTPIDWIHELVRTAMLASLVSGSGALVSRLGDSHPNAVAPSALANNQPNVSTPMFATLMVVATVIATSSVLPLWRHRHAVRTSPERPLGETLVASGAWLAAVVAVLGATGLVVGVELVRAFVLETVGGLVMIAAGMSSLRRATPGTLQRAPVAFAVSGGALAVLELVAGLTGFPLPGREAFRDASACLAAGHRGLFRDSRATRVTAYRTREVALRRVECRTTFQYNDERLAVVVGRTGAGRDLRGAELFVRVVGTPLERARAACEILLADRCQAPLAHPSELLGFSAVPERGLLVPHVRDGRLAFLAVTYEYPQGRQTTVGRRRVVVPHEVELATGTLVDGR